MKTFNDTDVKKDTSQDGPTIAGKLSSISKPPELTDRQFLILKMLSKGDRPTEIADITGNSVYTIRTHVRAIIKRLGARNIEHCISKMYEGNRYGVIQN